jgi:predicted DNA binding CopG/RHH family protein
MAIKRPEGLTDEEKAAWMESEEGRRFLAQAKLRPARFMLDPNLVPVTIRLPVELRDRLRRIAAERGMGYQTLARQWLLERCRDEEEAEANRQATDPRAQPPAGRARREVVPAK